jgi:hypothetical protein
VKNNELKNKLLQYFSEHPTKQKVSTNGSYAIEGSTHGQAEFVL